MVNSYHCTTVLLVMAGVLKKIHVYLGNIGMFILISLYGELLYHLLFNCITSNCQRVLKKIHVYLGNKGAFKLLSLYGELCITIYVYHGFGEVCMTITRWRLHWEIQCMGKMPSVYN